MSGRGGAHAKNISSHPMVVLHPTNTIQNNMINMQQNKYIETCININLSYGKLSTSKFDILIACKLYLIIIEFLINNKPHFKTFFNCIYICTKIPTTYVVKLLKSFL